MIITTYCLLLVDWQTDSRPLPLRLDFYDQFRPNPRPSIHGCQAQRLAGPKKAQVRPAYDFFSYFILQKAMQEINGGYDIKNHQINY